MERIKNFKFNFFLIIFLGLCMFSPTNIFAADENVIYQSHVEDYGWMEPVVSDNISGTTGERKRIECINIALAEATEEDHISYSVHIQDHGWMDYVSDGANAGTEGESRAMEALRIKLSGPISEQYDIYYRAHSATFGWLGWAKNDEVSGSTGFGKRMEAFQVVLVPKGTPPIGVTGNHGPERDKIEAGDTGLNDSTGIEYVAYCSNIAWQVPVMNGATAGTIGQALPMEKVCARLKNLNGQIQYNTYLSELGWQTPAEEGGDSGLSDHGVHIEGIQFSLLGDVKGQYDIYYRAHVRNLGWLGWASNGASAGTKDANLPIEAVEIRLIHRGMPAPGPTEESYIDFPLYYQTHARPQPVPGKRTLMNYLLIALEPVGQTNYILGGGRSPRHPEGGVDGTYIGVYPQWKQFFDRQDANYNYELHNYEYQNGLDCSGYVGWVVYNTLNTTSGGVGEIDLAPREPVNYSRKGYGYYTYPGQIKEFRPGDMVSANERGHIYIVLGTCSDGSILLVHCSPPGVMITGTAHTEHSTSEATRLAHTYMKRYYPEYYRRYSNQLNRETWDHTVNASKFEWAGNVVSDPENIRGMTPQQVLKVLFNEKY